MKYKCLLIGMVMVSLSGCDSSTPKCGSDEAKNLVADIAIKPYLARSKVESDYDIPTLTVNNIRTQQHNSQLDIYTCAADIKFTYAIKPMFNKLRHITYTIQKTDDGNGEFYINVYGL